MQIRLDDNIELILNTLNSQGYEAFAVGGFVRDKLMGIDATDCDITTSATPNEIKHAFSNYKIAETGIKHGTVTVIINHMPYEITTYRTESNYTDSRHPDSVTFVKELKTDLARRDFTVNAIAFNPETGLIDPFNGIADIKSKTLRTVGDPAQRFSEDSLRILRALRFSSVIGFAIEENTAKAILNMSESLKTISAERIYTELKKLLLGANAREVVNKFASVLKSIIPINGNASALSLLPNDFSMRITALCGNDTLLALNNLKADNDTKQKCKLLLSSSPIPADVINHKLYISRIGRGDAACVAAYRRAIYNEDANCQTEQLLSQKLCLTVSELAVNGNDLLQIGIKGRDIGTTLESLLYLVITEKINNNKQELLSLLSSMR